MSTELFEFKYAPKTFDDLILQEDLKPLMRKYFDEKPNLMLIGPPGIGKGSYIDVFLKTTGVDYLRINGSDENSINDMREKVSNFAKGNSAELKYVYINECDHLSPPAQAMLRDLIEQVESITRFIFAGNYGYKMSLELCSRFTLHNLTSPPAVDVVRKCWAILDAEKVKYNKKSVVELVKRIWEAEPDIRATFKSLKDNIVDGVMPENIKISSMNATYGEILKWMQKPDPEQIRTILRSNQIDYVGLYRYIYNIMMNADEEIFNNDIEMIKLIGEHSYRNNSSAIPEINFMHMVFIALTNDFLMGIPF